MEERVHGTLEVGMIHKMVTGNALVFPPREGELHVRKGLIDGIDLPAELGGGSEDVIGVAVLPTCPLCGNTDDKPALILESLRLSECLACGQFLWYRPA